VPSRESLPRKRSTPLGKMVDLQPSFLSTRH
jgi:hypothetical protein